MRALARRFVAALVVVHGLIHLLGVVEGFGWADVEALDDSIGAGWAVVWLAATVLTVGAGVRLALGQAMWWHAGALAVVVSQVAIVSSWDDARAGTAANVVLLIAVVHGFMCEGPASLRATCRRVARDNAWESPSAPVVTEADLARLPVAVAHYVRHSGAVGRERVTGFQARLHGRIRARPDAAWMSFTAEQVNRVGHEPMRLFLMDATMAGLPVDVLHTFVGPDARMQVRLAGMLTMVDLTGPEMARSETVTIFNDLCVMAPAALVDESIAWREIDGHSVEGTYTKGAETVSAVLVFDDHGDLVDFVSDDRSRADEDAAGFTRTRWSTPLAGHREFDGRRAATVGEGRWHSPEGEFTYLELVIDDITCVTAPAAREPIVSP
jgi:hypothetical protein